MPGSRSKIAHIVELRSARSTRSVAPPGARDDWLRFAAAPRALSGVRVGPPGSVLAIAPEAGDGLMLRDVITD